jgi:hypothetical protein
LAAAECFETGIRESGELTALWPDLQCALACTLARRGVAWARARERLAEAFEILQDWSRAAQQRAGRRVLEDCAWEQMWILEHWGRSAEARLLDAVRRREYAGQLSFNFVHSLVGLPEP